MKLLPGPRDWHAFESAHLQLTVAREDFNAQKAHEALTGFGCAPTRVPWILGVLRASGRYDCYVQLNWVRAQHHSAVECFADAGLNFHIDHTFVAGKRCDHVPARSH